MEITYKGIRQTIKSNAFYIGTASLSLLAAGYMSVVQPKIEQVKNERLAKVSRVEEIAMSQDKDGDNNAFSFNEEVKLARALGDKGIIRASEQVLLYVNGNNEFELYVGEILSNSSRKTIISDKTIDAYLQNHKK